jgi:HEAT repeat protein
MSEKDKAALLPELLRSTQGNDASERLNALVVLQYYPNQKDAVVPLIINTLHDSDPMVRMMAVRALNKIDPQNPANSKSVSVLVGCMTPPQDSSPLTDSHIQFEAGEAVAILGELHRDPDVAIPVLIRALQSDNVYMRYNAPAALGKFGSQAKAAIPALTKALEDSNAQVRRQAAAALNLINSGAAAN